jgi:putative intracellular protease/amidase
LIEAVFSVDGESRMQFPFLGFRKGDEKVKKMSKKGGFLYSGILALCVVFLSSVGCQDKKVEGEAFGKKDIHALLLVGKNYGLNYFLMRDAMDGFGWRVTQTGVMDSITACPPVAQQLGIHPVVPDISLVELDDIDDYDCLVIPPAAGNYNPVPDSFGDLLGSPEALGLVKRAAEMGMPVFAICSGSRVLAAADVVRGKKMVGSPRFLEEYTEAGAFYAGNENNDSPPVIDGNIVTGTRGQYYNVANCQAIASLVEARQKGRTRQASQKNFLITKEPSFISGKNSWAKTYGGPEAEGARAISPCPDGGYLITGYTFSHGTGDADLLVIKTDGQGEEEWARTFGGAGAEYGNACLCLQDGYLIAGYTSSFGSGGRDVYVVKLDKKGKEIWSKTFGGPSWDVGSALCESGDGHFFVCGYTHSFGKGEEDVYLIKIDKKGNKIWSKTFGGARLDMANSISRTEDGGLLIGATSGSFSGNTDFYLIRTDSDGKEIWSKTYAAESTRGHAFDWCNAMTGTRDGGAILTGYADAPDVMDVFVVKTDADGNEVWSKSLGNNPFYDFGNAILQMEDGSYIVAGSTKSIVDNEKIYDNDLYVVKMDTDGTVLWEKSYGGSGSDWASSVSLTEDGDVVVAGYTNSEGNGFFDLLLLKLQDRGGNEGEGE